jgi:ribosomal protein S16
VRQTLEEQNKPSIELKTEEISSNAKTGAEVTQRKSMMNSNNDTNSKENIAAGPNSVRMIRYYKNNV